MNNGSGTTKIEFQSTTGNASIGGVTDVTGNFNVNTNKFNVVAASGNTSVAGTLAVTQGTTLTGALDLNNNANISGLVHLESTDQPDIVSGAPHTIQNNDYGALRVDGGGYFAGNVLFDGDIFLNGDFNQQEDATENYGLRNYLSVRYKIRAGSTAAYNPTFSNSNTSNLRVFGGAGVNQNLHVGAVNSGEGFFVGKKNSSDTVKFSVLGASGNTDIQGTLDVAGASEFNGTVDVDADFAVRNGTTDKFFVDNVTGNTTIEGTLLAKGNVNFNGTLRCRCRLCSQKRCSRQKTVKSATGNIATAGTLDVNGATEITNTLDVYNAVTFDQTLTVAGQTTINDSLIIQSNNEVLNINNGSGVTKFSVDTDNGNTNIIGTLTVGDATQINDTLGVSDVATFTRNTQQTITGNSITLDGAARFSGGVGISKNLAVGEDMTVYMVTSPLRVLQHSLVTLDLVVASQSPILVMQLLILIIQLLLLLKVVQELRRTPGLVATSMFMILSTTEMHSMLTTALVMQPYIIHLLSAEILLSMAQPLLSTLRSQLSMTLLLLWVVTQHHRLTTLRIVVLNSVITTALRKLVSSDLTDRR